MRACLFQFIYHTLFYGQYTDISLQDGLKCQKCFSGGGVQKGWVSFPKNFFYGQYTDISLQDGLKCQKCFSGGGVQKGWVSFPKNFFLPVVMNLSP